MYKIYTKSSNFEILLFETFNLSKYLRDERGFNEVKLLLEKSIF